MGIDIREMREGAVEAQDTAANVTTGAIVGLVGAATDPIGTVRKTVRRLDRAGDPVNTQLRRRATQTRNEVSETAGDVVSGNLAQRFALHGISMVKDRARRKDVVGDVLFLGLTYLHRGLQGYRSEVGKFETALQPPVRNGETRNSGSARRSTTTRARRTAATARRTAKRTARSASSAAGRTRRAAARKTA